MFIAIVQHTPRWVWVLFAALVALGLSQTRDRELSLTRVTVLPLAMVALSASGVLSAFGPSPIPIGAWLAGVAAATVFARHAVASRGAIWLARTQTVRVPGSWVPITLIVGLFAIKYAVGVSLAMDRSLAIDSTFAGSTALAYGSFAGLFLARSLSLRGLARVSGGASAA